MAFTSIPILNVTQNGNSYVTMLYHIPTEANDKVICVIIPTLPYNITSSFIVFFFGVSLEVVQNSALCVLVNILVERMDIIDPLVIVTVITLGVLPLTKVVFCKLLFFFDKLVVALRLQRIANILVETPKEEIWKKSVQSFIISSPTKLLL